VHPDRIGIHGIDARGDDGVRSTFSDSIDRTDHSVGNEPRREAEELGPREPRDVLVG
jgi:hypothetical protein